MSSKVHRVRFYKPNPLAIHCVSFNKSSKLLAFARSDASIELWDCSYAPYLFKSIPGVENGSVEALGWVHNRLLSTGLGGALVEWDIVTLTLKNTVLLTGYAAWCLDVDSTNTLVAVGTEQGYLNLYSVDDDQLIYERLFDKQEGRIMCCKFNDTGKVLVTGSVNHIRIWNVETGQATSRISVMRQGHETLVWSVAILSDNTVVSGDSHGRLTFWDGVLGEQIESYTTHKADILALTVSEEESNIYCSGVDPVIVNFVRVKMDGNKQHSAQWVKNVHRHIHEHDVRALAMNGDKLISVGADGYLTVSSYPPKRVMRIPHMVPSPRSHVCSQHKLLMLRYNNHLEIWKLGSYEKDDEGNAYLQNVSIKEEKSNTDKKLEQDTNIPKLKGEKEKQMLKVTEQPVKMVSIDSKKKKQIRCCGLSDSGEFIVYSTENDIRLLKLEMNEDQTNVAISKMVINGAKPCNHVAFTEDSKTMVIDNSGAIKVLQVDAEAGATVVQTIDISKHLKSSSILHLQLSKATPSGSYLALADDQCGIALWRRTKKDFEHYVTLPTYKCLPCAMTVTRNESLLITYVDQTILDYDLKQKRFNEWPNNDVPKQWQTRQNCVTSITVLEHRDAIVFQDDTSLWILEQNQKPDDTQQPKSKKKARNKKQEECKRIFKIMPIKYCANFHALGGDEAVSVEILPQDIVSQLPPAPAHKKRYI